VVALDRSLVTVISMSQSKAHIIELTVDTRRRLTIATKRSMLRRSRGLSECRRTLHVCRHARLCLLLFLRRRKTGTTLGSGTGHDALEEVCRAVTDRRWWLLGWSGVRRLTGTTSSFKFSPQTCNIFLIPATSQYDYTPEGRIVVRTSASSAHESARAETPCYG